MSIRGWCLLFLAATLSACDLPNYRYKMTVHVMTPEGDRAFSSVRGVRSKYVSSIMSSSGQTVKDTLTGEAVIMDMPGTQTVYALLWRADDPDYATYVTGPALGPHIPHVMNWGDLPGKRGAFVDEIVAGRQGMLALKGAYDLPRTVTHNPSHRRDYKPQQMWPMFVTFDDPKDPASVREITPEALGVTHITIEMTRDPIDTSIQKRLPWLAEHGRSHATLLPNPPRRLADTTPIQQVSSGYFSTELFK